MVSRIVEQMAKRAHRRAASDALGMTPAVGLRFSSARAMDANVENVFRLPVAESAEALQDATGAFYAIDGWSHADTDDLPAPP